MLEYASHDTMHLLELRDQLHDELKQKERLAWAREEFERLESIRWPSSDASEAFLKVKGARDLTRRELAVFRELVQWRDAAALKLDRATFRVVSNEVLFEAARVHPSGKKALGALKGMPRGILERSGEEMLAAVARGLAIPEDALPKFPRAPRFDRDPTFDHKVGALKAVRDAAATRLELDPGVFCSRERMEMVARLMPQTPEALGEIPEFRRWQIEELGEGFVKALEPWRAEAGKGGSKAKAAPAKERPQGSDSPYLD
jgi:ribonuclease D